MIIFAIAMVSPSTDLWTSIRGPIANHLWQSTIFAGVAALLTLALRHNQAKARYWLWFAASVKFLIPLSLLLSLGNYLAWSKAPTHSQSTVSFVIQEITEPLGPPQTRQSDSTAAMTVGRFLPALLLVAWFSGGQACWSSGGCAGNARLEPFAEFYWRRQDVSSKPCAASNKGEDPPARSTSSFVNQLLRAPGRWNQELQACFARGCCCPPASPIA